MKIKDVLLGLALLLVSLQTTNAQLGFSQEIGVAVGPVAFFSDFGQRYDLQTNTHNSGLGIGLLHYINFAYRADCNCYTRNKYFNDHFKIRTEADYHATNLDFFGDDAESNTFQGAKLRAQHGKAKVFEIGSSLEYWPLSIRSFQANGYRLAPFISAGVHYVYYTPEVYSDLGPIGSPSTTFNSFLPDPTVGREASIVPEDGSTYAIVGGIGARYKLGPLSDLIFEGRWHYYGSDWVEGFAPQQPGNPDNRANDWIFWVRFGYIYYIE
jgi:hypothetical protein